MTQSSPSQKTTQPIENAQKARDAAGLLPMLGVLFLVTPLVAAFTNQTDTSGVPSVFIYVFGVWAILILCTAILSRNLQRQNQRSNRDQSEP